MNWSQNKSICIIDCHCLRRFTSNGPRAIFLRVCKWAEYWGYARVSHSQMSLYWISERADRYELSFSSMYRGHIVLLSPCPRVTSPGSFPGKAWTGQGPPWPGPPESGAGPAYLFQGREEKGQFPGIPLNLTLCVFAETYHLSSGYIGCQIQSQSFVGSWYPC